MIADTTAQRVFVRRPRPTDQGYIASTWAKSMTGGKRTPETAWLNTIIDRMLDDPAVRILVASEPSKTDQIVGWLCYTPMKSTLIVHYAYTREPRRRQGIIKALLEHAMPGRKTIAYTMRGPDAESLATRYPAAIKLDLHEFLGDK